VGSAIAIVAPHQDSVGSSALALQSRYDPKMAARVVIALLWQIAIGLWVDQIFARKPERPGRWDFTWEPGHGRDCEIHDEVSLGAARQLFVDKQTVKSSSRLH
jgi:hypothetical protein